MLRRNRKRGQVPEGSAHILIGLIAILLILYILFLPEADRLALLDEQPTVSPGQPGTLGNVIFKKTVGRLEFFPPEGFDHFVPSVHIFEARNAQVLEDVPPFVVKNGWLVSQKFTTPFFVDDLPNTNNAILAFDTVRAQGDLVVLLNGEQVFEGPVQQASPPIALPKRLLRKENVLEFKATGVGFRFWRVNQFSLTNVKVIGDVTDVTRQKAQNIFTISPTERRNLLSATLSFIPSCEPREVGTLTVMMNDRLVSEAIPDCNTINRFDIDARDLNEGVNSLFFQTKKGDYRIDNIKVKTNLKEIRTFIEFFEVDPVIFEGIVRGRRAVFLEVDFVDDGQLKRAQVNINNHLTVIDQREPFYFRRIDEFLQPGARNFIEIIPETPLNIVEVRVSG